MGIGSEVVPELKAAASFGSLRGNSKLMGLRGAIDLSTILHVCLRRGGVSDEFHMSPRIPLHFFALEFTKVIKLLISVPMQVLLVLDGSLNPHKKKVNDGRTKDREEKQKKVDSLLKRSDLSKAEKTELTRGRSVHRPRHMSYRGVGIRLRAVRSGLPGTVRAHKHSMTCSLARASDIN